MKPGLVGTVLVVLAGGAVAGAVVLRDQTKAKRAGAEVEKADGLLAAGQLDKAELGYLAANRAAAQVGGLGGKRAAALEIAQRSRQGLRSVAALRAVELDPQAGLRLLTTLEPAPAGADERAAKLRADLLLDAALRLEAHEADSAARKVFALAAEALGKVESPRAEEAAKGQRRLTLLAHVVEAEEAIANGRAERALELARGSLATLSEHSSPFEDEARVERLRKRLGAIEAEADSGARLAAFKAKVEALAARVPTAGLGKLLPQVEALALPELPGNHPRVKDHDQRLKDLEARLGRIKAVAQAFAGMVWLRKTSRGALYIDPTEVTVGAYEPFLAEYAKADPQVWGQLGLARLKDGRLTTRDGKPGPRTWVGGKPPSKFGPDHPVTGVGYFEAEAFARWSGKRLPTVEEFRSAAGGKQFPWGSSYQPGRANLKDARKGGPLPVGSFKKGEVRGIQDLIGNVREIVREGDKYVLIGGSYLKRPQDARLTQVIACHVYLRGDDMGFRCVKELEWDD